jgi:hypothetical protein
VEITLTTPALLFPAVSLILLAYTNRFLGLASLIRNLHDRYQDSGDTKIPGQIANLRLRVALIRNMQALGVLCILLCVASMFTLFEGWVRVGRGLFAASLLALLGSLALSLREIQISVVALNLQLADMESPPKKEKAGADAPA